MVANPMHNKESQCDKGLDSSTEFDNKKTAVITIDIPGEDGARPVEAQHYIKSSGTVSIYLGARSEGIDIQTHISRCVIDRVDTHADDDGSGEDQARSLVAAGGRDVPPCKCGADLFDTAELDTVHYPAGGQGCRARHPRMVEGPAATCGSCGALVGAMHGFDAVVSIWDARGEDLPEPDDDQEDSDDSGPELVTDGGRDMYGTEFDGHNCITLVTDSDRDLCKTCRARQVAKASMTGFDDDDGNVEDLDIDLPDALSSDTDDDDDDRDDDPEIVTDGGRDVEPGDYVKYECTGDNVPDLWQVTAVHHHDRVNVDEFTGSELRLLNDIPAHVEYSLRSQDGEHHIQTVHEEDVRRARTGAMEIIDGKERSLVADGGVVVEPGDSVLHAGEQWRVSRSNSDLVEIYQLGSMSLIVPISTVEPVSEVQG